MRDLQSTWLEWVKAGSPMDPQSIAAYAPRAPQVQLASATSEPGGTGGLSTRASDADETIANDAHPSAAPLVPVGPAKAATNAGAGWKVAEGAASVYHTPEVLAQQNGPQARQMARPQPPQHAGQVILQSQASPADKPLRDASLPAGSVYR
jgi:hypothetical protein